MAPRTLASPLLLAALFLLGPSVRAEPSAADKLTARNLLLEGRSLLEGGDAHAALAKFQAAHAIMKVPTTGLDVAKAHEALGQLVEARAVAYEVTQMPAQPNQPAAFTEAQASAAAAIEALDSRIPSLVMRIQGAPKEAVTATIDGEQVPTVLLTEPLLRNPGKREVVVTARGYRTVKTTVELVDGVLRAVEVPIVLEKEIVVVRPDERKDETRSKGLIYAGIGLSGALAVVGVGTAIGAGAIYGPAQDRLDGKCTSDCKAEFEGLVSIQQSLAYTSLFTLIGAGVVGGATLAYSLSGKKSSDQEKAPQAAFVVMPGGGGVFVSGRW